jgi:hypothetical protein
MDIPSPEPPQPYFGGFTPAPAIDPLAREAHMAYQQTQATEQALQAAQRWLPPTGPTAGEVDTFIANYNRGVDERQVNASQPAWAQALLNQGVDPGWLSIQLAIGRPVAEVYQEAHEHSATPIVVLGGGPSKSTMPGLPAASQGNRAGPSADSEGNMPGFGDVMAWWYSMSPAARKIVSGANEAYMLSGDQALYRYWEATNLLPFANAEVRLQWLIALKFRGKLRPDQVAKLEVEIGRSARDEFHHG